MPKIPNWSRVGRLSQSPKKAKRASDYPGKYVNVDVYSHDEKGQHLVYTAVDSQGNYAYITASNGLYSSSRQYKIRGGIRDLTTRSGAKKAARQWMENHPAPSSRDMQR